MTTSIRPLHPYLTRIFPPLSGTIALLGLGTGIQSFLNPIGFSTNVGLPISSSSSSIIPYLQFIGVRNLSSGLGILTLLSIGGQRKAVGVLLLLGVVTGLGDGLVVWSAGEGMGDGLGKEENKREKKGKVIGHVIMAGLMGLVGMGMYLL